ncbi:MAG: HD domain-containing protein [Candidatus Omnitrophica bacterium]|nr:HD domain-containing protein [Candidatus Omnitrophota bacterium]
MTTESSSPQTEHATRGGIRLVPLREESLSKRLTIAFGFMTFIPFLIVVWAMVSQHDLRLALYFMAASAFIGYFLVARRTVQSVARLAQQARAVVSGKSAGRIDVHEGSEIGELAKSFNRITQELERKVEELESSRQLVKQLLSRISTAIISYEGIDSILNLIVENTVQALESQMGSLMLIDGEKEELYVKTLWTPEGVSSGGERIKLGEGIAGWVAREGRAMRSSGSPFALGLRNGSRDEGPLMCVPLKVRDHPIGIMAVLRQQAKRPFTDDDESLLASIGSQMAVAIENYRLNLDVERTYLETIMALAMAVEAKDPYSAGHSKRVGFYAMKIGERMGLDQEMVRMLQSAGTLHDVGKIGIKDEILLKATPLTPEEHKAMQQHSLIGEAIVKPVRSLGKVVALVRHHHERYDGSGYPAGLRGEEIPLGARILTVADTYDAMVTDRPYRKRLSVDQAVAELKKFAGVHFDPSVVEVFIDVVSDRQSRHGQSISSEDAPDIDLRLYEG